MGLAVKVKGVKELVRALKKKKIDYNRSFEIQLKRSALLVLRESKKLVPIDTGFLRKSGFVNINPIKGGGTDTSAIVAYTASYALFVHENTEEKWKGKKRRKPSKGKYWGPKGQSKYLEKPFRILRPKILRDLKKAMLLGKGV